GRTARRAIVSRLAAAARARDLQQGSGVREGEVPAAPGRALEQQLRVLTRGEGVLECGFDGYRPLRGEIWSRPRSDHNPLNRKEYLLHVQRGVPGRGHQRGTMLPTPDSS